MTHEPVPFRSPIPARQLLRRERSQRSAQTGGLHRRRQAGTRRGRAGLSAGASRGGRLLPARRRDRGGRLNAAAQIVGGFCLATGLARRFGAGLLAASLVPTVISRNPITGDAATRGEFGTDIALLGGVALASMDTEGEPDMFWRLRMRQRMLSNDAARRKAERTAKRALRSRESTAS